MKATLPHILAKLKSRIKEEINVSLLGKVSVVNGDGTVNAELLIGEESLVLLGVPVFIPGTKTQVSRFHLKPGDMGIVLCMDYDISPTFETGQKTVRQINNHGINPIFMPGFFQRGTEPSVQNNETVVGHEDSLISSTPAEIKLGNGATERVVLTGPLVGELRTLISAYNGHVHATLASPPPPVTLALNIGARKTKAE